MANSYGRLLIGKPGAGYVNRLNFTVPANKAWINSTWQINCQSASADAYALEHRKSGEAEGDGFYVVGSTTRTQSITQDSVWGFTEGICAEAGDIFTVWSLNGTCVFVMWGNQIDQTGGP